MSLTRLSTWLALVGLLAGCNGGPTNPSTIQQSSMLSSSPSPPTPTPGPPPDPKTTLSGVVYEHTFDGRRPVAGAHLDVSRFAQSWSPQTTSDAEGRYQVSGLSGPDVKVNAAKPSYYQLCRAAIRLTTDNVLDVHLVSREVLSTIGVPPTIPIDSNSLTGRIFERTPDGVQPITGVELVADFSGGWGWDPGAQTITDAAGRYRFCGIRDGDTPLGLEVWVSKPGYRQASVYVDIPRTRSVDIELVRQ